jgi:intermediate peptidase
MLKSSRRQFWACSSCLRQIQRRNASTAAVAAISTATSSSSSSSSSPSSSSPSSKSPVFLSTPTVDHDDKVLRQVFDSRQFWNQFSKRAREGGQRESVGLVRNRYLATPEGFMVYAQRTMRKCSMLVNKILDVNDVEGYKGIVADMDRLSDLLCRVIDLADFIRSTHPDHRYQHAATAAYSAMFQYMNQLNTTTGLNDQLRNAIAMKEVSGAWTEEETTVAHLLMKDFQKSAIDLPEKERQDFVRLCNDIANTGTDFVEHMAPKQHHVRFRAARLKGMSPVTIKSLSRFGMATIPSTGPMAVNALSNMEDPDARRELYMANRTASDSTIRLLERMLHRRSQLATLAGYESYAHMALSDKMAKTPDAVNEFLHALKADTQPIIQSELREMLELKNSDAQSNNFQGRINAWDKDYYVHRLMSGLYTRIRSPDALASYFSLGTVFQGLSRLFWRVYGIRFVPQEPLPGETWHPEVRRLAVIDESNKTVAVVYCDLFARAGKSPNPAHFTLRCSRAISAAEVAEFSDDSHPFPNAVAAATEGLAYAVNMSTSTVHQLPTIALICDFDRPIQKGGAGDIPTLLPLRDVQTLFHEMGHALHSILGRTALQNVSGTRCATDLAELPSVLMEYFAFSPQALQLWARHWSTDKPLPFGLVEDQLRIERRMQGIETEGQIMMALVDQALHAHPWASSSTSTSTSSSTAIYHSVYAAATLPDPPGTAWQGFFGHMYGYGATYYSYLFCRAVAGQVWKEVFASGDRAVDREAGDRFHQELLRWGGTRDGWRCIAGVLGDERLAAGDPEAMRMVGRWGVRGEMEV